MKNYHKGVKGTTYVTNMADVSKMRIRQTTTGFSLFKGIGFGVSSVIVRHMISSTAERIRTIVFLCFQYEIITWYKKDMDNNEFNATENTLKEAYEIGRNSKQAFSNWLYNKRKQDLI